MEMGPSDRIKTMAVVENVDDVLEGRAYVEDDVEGTAGDWNCILHT